MMSCTKTEYLFFCFSDFIRKALVRLIGKLEQGTLKEGKILSNRVIELHWRRQGNPRKRKGPISGTRGTERFRSEEPFYVNPLPDCLCKKELPMQATEYPTLGATIRCSKIEVDADNEDRFKWRSILTCFGATVGLELVRSSGTFVEMAEAADLIQRRQRSDFQSSIKDTLYKAIKENPDVIPSLLTLALNDIMTYDKVSKSGGPNGSIQFSSEISRPENKGLVAQSAIKQTFLASAIRKCGGNVEKGSLLYTAYGSNGQWGLFERNFGRADTQEPDPEGRVPQWDKASVQEMKDKFSAVDFAAADPSFSAVGFGPRQLAVMSGFLGPDQIATETLLATDPEVLPWVQKYQHSRETVSETDYEVDLITTLTKLSGLGQHINYEAYTYPVKKVDLSKLKL
ncbi:hypothetical protein ABKV19_014510 [Rosa sericea]